MASQKTVTAREIALQTLSACERQGAWSDGYLNKALREARLDGRDAALATRLCFGVLQNRMLLDFYLGKFSSMPPEKMEINVRCALRLAVYQMAFLTKIPASAAVNESVELVKRYSKNPRAAGLCNGVLRALARHLDDLPQVDRRSSVEYLATLYSHPVWLVEEFIGVLGPEEAEALLRADNQEPPTCIQVNTLKTTAEELLRELSLAGAQAQSHPWLEDCLFLTGAGDLERLPAFQEGRFYVQDPAARLAVMAAGAEPGMRVLDACAAPGGKSFAAAIAMEDRGEIVSCDIHSRKQGLIESGAARLGLGCITARTLDAKLRREEFAQAFDLVVADVPCSGLGIIRKKPDIRYKDPGPLENLPAVQSSILDNVAGYVRPGGVLLYATCTLRERENGAVVRAFLKQHGDFALEQFRLPEPIGCVEEGMLTLWPHRHGTDGFFFARLRRSEGADRTPRPTAVRSEEIS